MGYQEVVLADAPRAYYRFKEQVLTQGSTLADSSGNGLTANVYNLGGIVKDSTPLISDQATDSAIRKASANTGETLEVPDNALLNISGSAFSIETWLKAVAGAQGAFGTIVSKTTNGSTGYILQTNNSSPWLKLYVWDGAAAFQASYTGTGPFDGAWHHFVVTIDGASVRFYLDGVLKQTSAFAHNLVTPAGRSAWFLADPGFSSTDFLGSIDELAIYAATLSPERVAVHYAAGAFLPPFGLVEPIARAIKAELITRLPISRAAVEAAVGVPAGSIADVAEITLGQRSNHALYPAIEIEAASHRILSDAPDYMKSSFVIPVIAIVTRPVNAGADPEEDLTLLVWRYERIVIDALMAARKANKITTDNGLGVGLDIQDENIDYSPIRFIAGDLFARDIYIPTVCTVEEVRT